MKVALCFIISYKHILNKEELWKTWIKENQDIINVYFHYKDIKQIQSQWILEHCIPENCIYQTSYYHVIPAYLSLMNYAFNQDKANKWFCFLTDSCCPIISPQHFRYLFQNHYYHSIMSWRKAWWNPVFHKRANLILFPDELRLANDPWFTLTRNHVQSCLGYIERKKTMVKTICSGGLANESLFAIILHCTGKLPSVLNKVTHAADWSRMMNSTSPYLFSQVCDQDIDFIEKTLDKNNYIMFLRKVAPEFPDEVLIHFWEKCSSKNTHLYNVSLFEKLKQGATQFSYLLWILLKMGFNCCLFYYFYCLVYAFYDDD
jgi:hypothetical protein